MSEPSSSGPVDEVRRQVVLNYVDKVHGAFRDTRSYTNRLLIALVVVSTLVVAVAAGAATTTKVKVSPGLGDFTFDLWALLLAGAIFGAVVPGFVVGRLAHMRELADEIYRLYKRLDDDPDLRAKQVQPFEVSAIVSEVWRASERRRNPPAEGSNGSKRTPGGRSWDFVGGPLAALLVVGVPVTAQVFAGWYWIKVARAGPLADVAIGIGVALLVVATAASFRVAVSRWWSDLFPTSTADAASDDAPSS